MTKVKNIVKVANEKSATGIPYVIYILSWLNSGHFCFDKNFEAWLYSCRCSKEDVEGIVALAFSYDKDLGMSAVRFNTIHDQDSNWVVENASTKNEKFETKGGDLMNKRKF